MFPLPLRAAALPALLLWAGAAAADPAADCRNQDLAPADRLAPCAAAAESAATAAARAEFLDWQARILRLHGDLATAEPLAQEAHRLAPSDPDPIATLGDILHDRGDYAAAQAELDRALAMDPDDPRLILAALRNLPDAGQAPRCLELAVRAMQVAPERAHTWAYRGRCLLHAGRSTESAADLRRALDRGLDEAWVHDNLSFALFDLQDFEGAADAAYRAVELDPMNGSARVSLMGALAATGFVDDALSVYSETTALGLGEDQDAANHLAWVLYQTGHAAEALPVIEGWVQAHPDPGAEGVSELDTYAHVLAALGRPEDAAAAFEAAVENGSLGDRTHYMQRLQALGFRTDDGLEGAFLACARTGAACRLSD